MNFTIKDIKTNTSPKPSLNILEILNRDISIGQSVKNTNRKTVFFTEIALLVNAGIDINTSIDIYLSKTKPNKFNNQIRAMNTLLISGSSLSTAMKEQDQFTAYDFTSVKIGEETGSIGKVFLSLASYYESKIKQRRVVINALSYPSIVLFTALCAIFFMMNFIVPMFKDIFGRFKGELPWITKKVIHISDMFTEQWPLLILFMLIIFITAKNFLKMEWFKSRASLIFKIPFIGELLRKIRLLEFCQSMSLLLEARVPLDKSLLLTSDMITFHPIKQSILLIHESILKGQSFYKSSEPHGVVFDKQYLSMIHAGEEVNKLDYIFKKLTEQYQQEIEFKSQRLKTYLEPLIIVFLAVLIGIVLISIYLPLLSLTNTVSG